MSDKTKIYETVMDILADVTGDEVVKEEPDINLPEEGLIDSLGYIELLLDIEEEMDTPAKIAAVVQSKAE